MVSRRFGYVSFKTSYYYYIRTLTDVCCETLRTVHEQMPMSTLL